MHDHGHSDGPHSVMNIEVSITGEPVIKTGSDIVSLARKASFDEEHKVERQHDKDFRITYLPHENTPSAWATAVIDGLLLYQMNVEGSRPRHINLHPGTYYYYVQRIDGRWLGFAVDTYGRLACTTVGVVFRQTFNIHPGADHPQKAHFVIHPTISEEAQRRLGGGDALTLAAAQDWVEYHTWEEHGTGCITTIFCSPTT